MRSFFPDLNVWVALSVKDHTHSVAAWQWLSILPRNVRLLFSRYTQIGLLRLLTNSTIMGSQTLTLSRAWGVYDQWKKDPRIEFLQEPWDLESTIREATRPIGGQAASKSVGDCYLLAFAQEAGATLVTFDRALSSFGGKHGYDVLRLSEPTA